MWEPFSMGLNLFKWILRSIFLWFRSRDNQRIFSFNTLDSRNFQSYRICDIRYVYCLHLWSQNTDGIRHKKGKKGKQFLCVCRKQDVKFLTIICWALWYTLYTTHTLHSGNAQPQQGNQLRVEKENQNEFHFCAPQNHSTSTNIIFKMVLHEKWFKALSVRLRCMKNRNK